MITYLVPLSFSCVVQFTYKNHEQLKLWNDSFSVILTLMHDINSQKGDFLANFPSETSRFLFLCIEYQIHFSNVVGGKLNMAFMFGKYSSSTNRSQRSRPRYLPPITSPAPSFYNVSKSPHSLKASGSDIVFLPTVYRGLHVVTIPPMEVTP